MHNNDEKDLIIFKKVAALLKEEREALLQGDLEKVEELLERKIALSEDLKATSANHYTGLSELRQTALQNQKLLDEALTGIKTVVDRISEMRRVKESLDTYDAAGRRQTIENKKKSIERRA